MLAITDHNFRNTNLSCAAQRLVQNCIGFLPTFLRLQEIWPVEKLRIHLFQTHEIGDVDRMRGFDPHLLEILILQDNIPAAFILEASYDLVGWNFLGVRLGNLFVSDWAEVARTQLPKADLFLACGRINGHGDINQPKADAAFPDGAHMGFEPLFHTATRVCQPSGRLAWPAVKEAAHQIALQLLETAGCSRAAYEPPRQLHELGRTRLNRHPAHHSGLIRSKETTGTRPRNGTSGKRVPKSKGRIQRRTAQGWKV